MDKQVNIPAPQTFCFKLTHLSVESWYGYLGSPPSGGVVVKPSGGSNFRNKVPRKGLKLYSV